MRRQRGPVGGRRRRSRSAGHRRQQGAWGGGADRAARRGGGGGSISAAMRRGGGGGGGTGVADVEAVATLAQRRDGSQDRECRREKGRPGYIWGLPLVPGRSWTRE
jgi:hypothetical protein